MARQFFVRWVCRYGLPVTKVFQMTDQVMKTSNERLWVSDLVEKRRFIKLLDIEHDWALENMIVE